MSNKVIPIPGEDGIIVENIYVEYFNLADKYYSLEDYNKAAKYYKMSMDYKKLYWASYYKLAKCYALLSDWTNATPMYKNLLLRDPENLTLKASVGYMYIMQGELAEAKKIFLDLMEKESNNQSYIENYLAVLMCDLNSFKENKDEITQRFSNFKNDFPDNKNIVKFENSIKKYEETIEKENKKDETTEADSSVNNPIFINNPFLKNLK